MFKLVLSAILVCGTMFLVTGKSYAQTEQCFENAGLKENQMISFVVLSGNKVEGTFEKSGYDDMTSGEMFGFLGTKKGNQLTIKFASNVPYQLPRKTKTITWTLAGNTLKVPMYGKNYDTNKFAAYTATFEKCK